MSGVQQGQMPEGEMPQMQQSNNGDMKAQMNKRVNTNATTLAASTTK